MNIKNILLRKRIKKNLCKVKEKQQLAEIANEQFVAELNKLAKQISELEFQVNDYCEAIHKGDK